MVASKAVGSLYQQVLRGALSRLELRRAPRPEQFGMTSRTAIGAIPAVKLLRHMKFPWPLPACIAAAFKAFGNVTSSFHGSISEHARRQMRGEGIRMVR